jgi:TDG/mug DNA glycosylase family protein
VNTLTDVVAPGLRVLFCGINPGLYSAFTGHHFARPGNRFWPTLHAAGLTPRRLSPEEDRSLLDLGYGLTNLVERASVSADELTPAELVEGGRRLAAKVERLRPRFVAFLSIGAYRTAFGRPRAAIGRQEGQLHGAALWVLPSPSGLNAHYRPADLARLYGELRAAVEEGP